MLMLRIAGLVDGFYGRALVHPGYPCKAVEDGTQAIAETVVALFRMLRPAVEGFARSA